MLLPFCTHIPSSPQVLKTERGVGFWDFGYSARWKVVFQCYFHVPFPKLSEGEHLCMCLRPFRVSFPVTPVRVPCPLWGDCWSLPPWLRGRGPYVTKLSPLSVLWVLSTFPRLSFLAWLDLCVCMFLFMQKTVLLLCSQTYAMFLLWPLVSGAPQRHVNNSYYRNVGTCTHAVGTLREIPISPPPWFILARCDLVMCWDRLGFPETVAASASYSGCHRGVPAHISCAPLPLAQLKVLSPLSKWGSHLQVWGERNPLKTMFQSGWPVCITPDWYLGLDPLDSLCTHRLCIALVFIIPKAHLLVACWVLFSPLPLATDINKWVWGILSPKCMYVCARGHTHTHTHTPPGVSCGSLTNARVTHGSSWLCCVSTVLGTVYQASLYFFSFSQKWRDCFAI